MALNLKEVFAPAAIAAYWTNDPTNAMPFASDALFPAQKKAGLDLKWIRGHKGVGVSLMPSAFDAKATFRTREGFKFDETEMPFFREGYHLGEKDRQEILRVLDSNDPYARDVVKRIYDDVSDLVTGARIVPERMIWQLLAPANGTPGITIKANGVNYTYNYDPDGTWKKSNYKALTTSAKWDTPASATPISDLIAAADAVNDATGEEVTRVFMNKATLAKMIAADEVKNRFLTINNRTTSVLTANAPVVITIGAGTTAYPLTDCNCAQATAEIIHTRTRYATRVATSATGTGTFKYLGCFCRSHAGAPASIS